MHIYLNQISRSLDLNLSLCVMMLYLPPQGTPPTHSSRHGPQRTQHTASTAATPRHPQGRRQTPADAPALMGPVLHNSVDRHNQTRAAIHNICGLCVPRR